MKDFNDPDGNSLELITKIDNPNNITSRMYLSEWEKENSIRESAAIRECKEYEERSQRNDKSFT